MPHLMEAVRCTFSKFHWTKKTSTNGSRVTGKPEKTGLLLVCRRTEGGPGQRVAGEPSRSRVTLHSDGAKNMASSERSQQRDASGCRLHLCWRVNGPSI